MLTGVESGTLVFGSGDDTINVGTVRIAVNGGEGADSIIGGDGANELAGGAGADTLNGANGADRLNGGADNDLVNGGGGADQLNGGSGSDSLFGGGGRDTLDGGSGADTLTGGQGSDRFVFSGLQNAHDSSLITDLSHADVIDLSGIDADTTQTGDQAFTLVSHLDGHAGEAALVYDGSADVTYLELDTDGDGKADATIDLAGKHADFSNFVL